MSVREDVVMWRVEENGDVESTGWVNRADETVYALMEKTASWWDWKNYKLAYGKTRRLFSAPTKVQWAREMSESDLKDTKMGDLFAGVEKENNEMYFLMISKLKEGVTTRQQDVMNSMPDLYLRQAQLVIPDEADLGTLLGALRKCVM
jgi:hypothetical protein